MTPADYHTRNAVLFLFFRRHEFAAQAFEAIRAAQPPRLYLAGDAPRAGNAADIADCQRTLAVVKSRIDWPCTVHFNVAEHNLGCGRRVSSAIDWAFATAEQLIILEEDCIAGPDFFRFCDTLLERYASDERVAMISGSQFVPGGWPCGGASYSFIRLSQIWGWATWRRAWKNYDFEMRSWPEERQKGLIERTFRRGHDRRHWRRNFDHALEIDSWDYQWCFARWRRQQAGIVPARNLISNIGFGPEALHTTALVHPAANVPRAGLAFPLAHPPDIVLDDALDDQFSRLLFSDGFQAWWNYQRDQRLAKWLPAIFPPR